MSWFFNPSGAGEPRADSEDEDAAPQSPASAAAAAFGAVAQDARVQRVAVDFVQDPGVKEAAQSFARDERVKVAALKATGLEGGAAIVQRTDESRRKGAASQREVGEPARRASAEDLAAAAFETAESAGNHKSDAKLTRTTKGKSTACDGTPMVDADNISSEEGVR